ncbi:MAG: hypothetical protein V7756_09535 [Halopseudomonas sp.]|uniref:phage tail assembly chaperone n=1 Tax=Halopseudomonas sp. TaxID=2901191 RepID=UPI0030016582
MRRPNGSKLTVREQLQNIEKSGFRPPELDTPPIPAGMEYIWQLYFQIKRGLDPLSYQELQSWCQLTRQQLDPAEVEAIMKLDTIVTRVMNND